MHSNYIYERVQYGHLKLFYFMITKLESILFTHTCTAGFEISRQKRLCKIREQHDEDSNNPHPHPQTNQPTKNQVTKLTQMQSNAQHSINIQSTNNNIPFVLCSVTIEYSGDLQYKKAKYDRKGG